MRQFGAEQERVERVCRQDTSCFQSKLPDPGVLLQSLSFVFCTYPLKVVNVFLPLMFYLSTGRPNAADGPKTNTMPSPPGPHLGQMPSKFLEIAQLLKAKNTPKARSSEIAELCRLEPIPTPQGKAKSTSAFSSGDRDDVRLQIAKSELQIFRIHRRSALQ